MNLTYIFYIALAILCGFYAYRAEKTEKKLYIWLLIAVLTLISGLRDASVGLDTQSYLDKSKMLALGRFDLAYGLEDTFKMIVFLIQKMVPSGQFVLLLLAFVTNWCIINRFWELRSISWFTCMVLCYYLTFYFTTMNTVRQFCAVSIVFYGVRYLDQKRVLDFVKTVILAMLLHQSAAVGFVFLAIYCLRWKELPQQQKKAFYLCVVVIPVVVVVLLLTRFFGRYTKYFTALNIDIGVMLPLKLVLFALVMRIYLKTIKDQKDTCLQFRIVTAVLGYTLALILGMTGYVFELMDRISWYFFLYEGVCIGILLKEESVRRRIACGCVAGCLVIYSFAYSMLNNSQGQMPYRISKNLIEVGERFSVCGYTLDEQGRIVELNNGIVKEDGKLFYYENGNKTYAGLIFIEGEYYYARSNGQLAADCVYWITKNNDLLPQGYYLFDADGKLVYPDMEDYIID